MLRILSLLSVLVLAGCATGMYNAPSGDEAVTLKVDNQLASPAGDSGDGAWQMPMSTSAKASIFKVNGERISEQGGAESVLLEPGKQSVEVYADQGGILRFGKFRYTFDEGGVYQVRIKPSGGSKDYTLELVKASAPQDVLVSKDF
ncbi:MAG: hypothetical protein MI745_11830 [Pseudomonadales bacterium]|nr:hypothetical protein [Pseudomonadales bacterium]